MLKAARASGGRILEEGGRLRLPEHAGDPAPGDDDLDGLTGYVIFDLQTTSADAEEVQILELAAVRVQAGQEVATFERLISGVVLTQAVVELPVVGHLAGRTAAGVRCRWAAPIRPQRHRDGSRATASSGHCRWGQPRLAASCAAARSWTEVTLPLDAPRATHPGERVAGPALDPGRVVFLGLPVGHNRAERLMLGLDWIGAQ